MVVVFLLRVFIMTNKRELAEMLGMRYSGEDEYDYIFDVYYKDIRVYNRNKTIEEAWEVAAEKLFDMVLECVAEKL